MHEEVILENLFLNENFFTRALPYIKPEYFQNPAYATIIEEVRAYAAKYHQTPTPKEIAVQLHERKGLNQQVYDDSVNILSSIVPKNKAPSIDWLLEITEEFCKDRALHSAILNAIQALENDSVERGIVRDLVTEALAVSFDQRVGLDYTTEIEERYKLLHKTDEYRVPFHLEIFNRITGGGLTRKVLAIVVAPTGAGKTLFLCDLAANYLKNGKNVLYITMEMAEEKIGERIDANLMNTDLKDLQYLSLQEYKKRLERGLGDSPGRLFIKEYPTSNAGVNEFRALLNELKLKKKFEPEVIIVDYVNICSSARYKAGAVNSYQYIKSICEELRGLAIEYNLPIFSATQVNREGTDTSDFGLREISESHGLAMTVDLLLGMIRTEELDQQNLIMFKQLKSRFDDITRLPRFVVGVDRAKMKLYDVVQDQSNTQPSPTPQQPASQTQSPTKPKLETKTSVLQELKSRREKFSKIKV